MSFDGLRTWFKYDFLITVLALAFVILLRGGSQFGKYLGRLSSSTDEFVLTLVGFCFGVLLLLLWWSGQYNR